MAYKKKSRKEAEVNPMTEEELRLLEEHADDILKSQLPIGRIKKICRLDSDVEMINNEALRLMTKAAELFILELGKAANTNAAMERRKNVQLKDIEKCIKKSWSFAFLEDALDGWPKPEAKKRKNPITGEETTILEETTVTEDESQETIDDDLDEILDETVDDQEDEIDNEIVPETPEDDIMSSENIIVDKFAEQF